MSLSAGSRLGEYEILSPLGAGGMGELFRAKDRRLGRDVAIKVLRSDVEADAERRRRFEQEAKAASALNHPNIVTIYHIGDHETASYIVMELVAGSTLRERLDGGPLELSLTPEEDRAIAERPIDDLRAYEYYARARQEHYRFTPDAIGRAIELLDKGIEIVGDNELLYAAKGISYWTFMHMELVPHSESHQQAARLCEKAFALGGRTSQAYFLRGGLATFGGDLQGAVRDYKRSLEIQPGNSDAHFWLCMTYLVAGRVEAARRTLTRLFEIDPLTPANYWLRGNVEWIVGRFEAALEEQLAFVEKDPQNPLALYFVGTTLSRMGRGEEAEPYWDRVRASAPDGVHDRIAAVYRPAVRGDTEATIAALTPALRESAAWHFGVAGDLASACALGGAYQEALELVESAIDLGWVHADFYAKHDLSFAPLRGDERFERLMAKARRRAAAFEE